MNSNTRIQGTIVAPPSKSMTQRAVAAALLASGTSRIQNPSRSDDAVAARNIVRALGATVAVDAGEWRITNHLPPQSVTFHCGESALCVRLFAPIAAALTGCAAITGSGTLLSRSMSDVTETLSKYGVAVTTTGNGRLPIRLTGMLQPVAATIDASAGSQMLSGLLMALPLLHGDSQMVVERLVSRPYIDMTVSVLNAFGVVNVSHENYQLFTIKGRQSYLPQTYIVEGDWSSAAFWLVAAAIGGRLTIKNLLPDSPQADRRVLEPLQAAGATVNWHYNVLEVAHGTLLPFHFDATHSPDLFPPLTLLAACCNGTSVIKGTCRLTNKESHRALAIQTVAAQLGIHVERKHDEMIVHGGKLHGGHVPSFSDHRIAMMALCAGLFTDEPVVVDDVACINKSYPDFLIDLNTLKT